MDAIDKFCIKTALELLRAAGGTGLKKTHLLSQMSLAAGAPITAEQQDAAFATLMERGWIEYHIEPIWHDRRWAITERGMTALEGM